MMIRKKLSKLWLNMLKHFLRMDKNKDRQLSQEESFLDFCKVLKMRKTEKNSFKSLKSMDKKWNKFLR